MSTQWEIAKDFPLYFKSWSDEYIVYCRGSGDTHMLDSTGYEILRLLEKQASTIPELTSHLHNNLNVIFDDEELRIIVDNLVKLGMIKQVDA